MADESENQATATVIDGKVFCECGSTSFSYEEEYPTWRNLASNESNALVFYSDFEWGEGNDDPGVVCSACQSPVTLPDGVEVDWR